MIQTHVGELVFTQDFENGYHTEEAVTKLYDELDFQPVCQMEGTSSWMN